MDLSLWDAPVVQVADDDHFCNRNDWYCDFHFGYGQDVIEEDAMNETSCMQVLKILIEKTDDEIMQLEYNISVLETSLDFANTELSELCSVVRERSDCLEKPIQLCKDVHDEYDPGFHLQSDAEPAESVHEIIRGPPCKDLQQKTEKCGSATASIPSTLAGVGGNEKDMSKNSEAPEGDKRINAFNSLIKGVKRNPHDMPQKNMRKLTELATAPISSPFLGDDDVGSQKVVRRIFVPNTDETQKVSGSLHNDEMEDPSANPQQKTEGILESNCCNRNKSFIANILVISSAKVSGEGLENTDGKYDSELEMKGVSNTSSKGRRKVNCSKTYESKCLMRSSIKDVNEYPVEREAASNVGCVTQVRKQRVVSMPSSDAKVASAARRSKADIPVCFVEDSCRIQDHEKILQTSRQKNGSRKKPALSRKKKKETDSLLQIKGKHKRSTEMENISVDSLIELINGRNDANRPQKKVKGKSQASHIKEPEAFFANGSINKEYTKMKRKHQVKQETVEQAEKCEFNVAPLEMMKRHKSDTSEFLGLNNTNIEGEEESDLVGAKLADGSLLSIRTTATQTPNGNNESTILPLSYENEDSSDLQIENAKIHDIMMKIKLEESTEILSCSSTSDPRVQIAENRLTVSDLERMTLPKLKGIAKHYKLRRYIKLTKAKLISLLAQELELGSSHQ